LTKERILGIRVDPPTKTISSIYVFFKSVSLKTVETGSIVFLNRSKFNSSNLARVRTSETSRPSTRSSISILVS